MPVVKGCHGSSRRSDRSGRNSRVRHSRVRWPAISGRAHRVLTSLDAMLAKHSRKTAPGAVSDAAWMVEDSRTCNRGDLGRSAGIVDNKIGKTRLRSEDELFFSVMEEPHARAYGVESLKIRRRESFEIVSLEPRSFWS